jgi:putative chitinase
MITKKLITTLPKQVIDELPSVIDTFKITSPQVLAHFLAQCAHESGNFRYTRENLNYSADALIKTFPKYFSKDTAQTVQRKPELIANIVYSNRMGNGDKQSGDGWKYRGRGYIQLTGKSNYVAFGKYINENLIEAPDLVATKYPLMSAAWFFEIKKLWQIASVGIDNDTIIKITKIINGGTNGLDDRISKTKIFNSFLC